MRIYELLDTTPEVVTDILSNKKNYYNSYPKKKSNHKNRWIDAPLWPLKDIQHNILFTMLYKFRPHIAATGFVKKLNVRHNATRHLGSRVLLNMDFHDFFGSISYDKVIKLMASLSSKLIRRSPVFNLGEARQAFKLVADLVTYKNRLPQGAPTSPAIANLYCISLDKELYKLATENDLVFTRYADDISFSHKSKDFNMGPVIKEIETVVKNHKLRINKKKTKVMRPHRRMMVTGIVINEKLSIPQWEWRIFRAKLHNIIANGEVITIGDYQKLRGFAEWVYSLHPERGNKFKDELKLILDNNVNKDSTEKTEVYSKLDVTRVHRNDGTVEMTYN